MSHEAAAPASKKKPKTKTLIVILGAVALLGGGGAAAGFYAAGSGAKTAVKEEDPNMPHFVLKGEKPEEIAKKYGGEEGHGEEGGGHAVPHKAIDLPRPKNPAAYQGTYYPIPSPFTSNMADSDAFAQISIAVSTYYDQRVITALQTHELAIRSSILLMLAQEQEIDLATPQGKEHLQAKLF